MTAPADNIEVRWQPLPGVGPDGQPDPDRESPQSRFLRAAEFDVFFGGAAGPGKSEGLLIGPTYQLHLPGFRGVIIRSTFDDLSELMDRAQELYPHWGGVWRGSPKYRWYFPITGRQPSTIEFRFFEKWKDANRYRGKQFSYIGWDEIGDCPEERFWIFLRSRCRSGGPGIQPMMRCAGNPGGVGHGWLKRRYILPCGKQGAKVHWEHTLVDGRHYWLSRRFIPGRVTDNPVLLENNPLYLAQLGLLPLTLRRQLLEGDWDAGEGIAFEELDEHRHLVAPFQVPPHWTVYASFDWGYMHHWAFHTWAVNEDGRRFVLDTIRGRRMKDSDIIDRITHNLPPGITKERIQYVAAGHDCWSEIKARQESGPSTQKRFVAAGFAMRQANISRSDGYRQLMEDFAWKGDPARGIEDRQPALVLLDTEGNRWTWDCLVSRVVDPDNQKDVLKTDDDPLTGDGGDDPYDSVRYGAMEWPRKAKTSTKDERVRAFSKETLAYEREQKRRGKFSPQPKRPKGTDPATEHGGF